MNHNRVLISKEAKPFVKSTVLMDGFPSVHYSNKENKTNQQHADHNVHAFTHLLCW